MKRWVQITANMSLGAYEIFEAGANIPDPDLAGAALHGAAANRLPRSACRSSRPSGDLALAGGDVSAGRICRPAGELVDGERRHQYGAPVEAHERIARLWSAFLGIEIDAHTWR